jgi:hypothetical protein
MAHGVAPRNIKRKKICVAASAKAAIRHNLLWKCDHPNLVRGGTQSRQRGIGDGDDGSGPRSLLGRMAPTCIADINLKSWARQFNLPVEAVSSFTNRRIALSNKSSSTW